MFVVGLNDIGRTDAARGGLPKRPRAVQAACATAGDGRSEGLGWLGEQINIQRQSPIVFALNAQSCRIKSSCNLQAILVLLPTHRVLRLI
jgi:hypothetical protein